MNASVNAFYFHRITFLVLCLLNRTDAITGSLLLYNVIAKQLSKNSRLYTILDEWHEI